MNAIRLATNTKTFWCHETSRAIGAHPHDGWVLYKATQETPTTVHLIQVGFTPIYSQANDYLWGGKCYCPVPSEGPLAYERLATTVSDQ